MLPFLQEGKGDKYIGVKEDVNTHEEDIGVTAQNKQEVRKKKMVFSPLQGNVEINHVKIMLR